MICCVFGQKKESEKNLFEKNIIDEKKCQSFYNRQLIEQTILAHYNQYYRLAYSYTHNGEDAGDIVQNGAYKALRSSDALQKPEYVATWLYRIMLNECFQYLKQPKAFSYETMQQEYGTETGYAEDYSVRLDLRRALDELPEKEKAIIILKYFEDKKLEEIAEILDENVNTIKSRLYRSMKKLRSVLSSDFKSGDFKD